MQLIAKIISWCALALVVILPVLFLMNVIELNTVKTYLMIATIVWFVSAAFYMLKDDEPEPDGNPPAA